MADPISEKEYSYTGLRRIGIIISQITGSLGILFFNFFGFGLLILVFISDASSAQKDMLKNPAFTGLCLAIWMIGFSWLIGSLFINHAPTIWVNKDGISISYYIFFKIFIPWADIVDVIDQKGLFTERTIVVAKQISLYHRITNRLYYHFNEPCFIIGNDIEESEKLVALIRSKALFNSGHYKP